MFNQKFNSMKKNILAAIAVIALLYACTQKLEKPAPIPPATAQQDEFAAVLTCDTTVFTYKGAIAPIMKLNCTSSRCHDATRPASGINLTTYTGVKKVASNGRLWGAVSHANGYIAMPKGAPKLSKCNLTQIKKWIDAGALNN